MIGLRNLLAKYSQKNVLLVTVPIIVNNYWFENKTKSHPNFLSLPPIRQQFLLRRAHMNGNHKTVKQIYEESLPSVVKIITYSKTSVKNTIAMSSGFVVKEGNEVLIITNSHCVYDSAQVMIKFVNKYKASDLIIGKSGDNIMNALWGRVVYVEPAIDLAMIRIKYLNTQTVPALKLSNTEPYVGQSVVLIGNPNRMDNSLNVGFITCTERTGGDISMGVDQHFETWIARDQVFINHTAAARVGFSGSPLFDMSGHVIGVAFGQLFNASFAVSAIETKRFIERGLEFEKQKESVIKHSLTAKKSLGVMLFRYPSMDGFIVYTVGMRPTNTENDLKKRDIITHINGTPFESIDVLTDAMNGLKDDEDLRITVFRKAFDSQTKSYVEKSVTLNVRPQISASFGD